MEISIILSCLSNKIIILIWEEGSSKEPRVTQIILYVKKDQADGDHDGQRTQWTVKRHLGRHFQKIL